MKTQWFNGQFLTTNFMQTFFGQTATSGHIHDGLNQDGSAPLVNLDSNVQGILPWTNIGSFRTGTFDGKIFGSSQIVTFTYSFYNGLATVSWPSIVIPAYWGADQLYFLNNGGINNMPLFLRPQQDFWMGPTFTTTNIVALPATTEPLAFVTQVHSDTAPNQSFQLIQFLPFSQGSILGSSTFPMNINANCITYQTGNYNV
jgi:hypothetical protein